MQVIFKMDIEKVCNHVNCDFIIAVLAKIKFSLKWIRWIKWCITIKSFSVLVNETLFSFF